MPARPAPAAGGLVDSSKVNSRRSSGGWSDWIQAKGKADGRREVKAAGLNGSWEGLGMRSC